MSSSLARLRRHFGDELLARVGNEYLLPPLALELRQRAQMALAGLERDFAAGDDFDPACSRREFTLQGSDYGEAVLGTAVVEQLARSAPGARLRYVANTVRPLDSSDPALLTTDLVVMPHGFVTDLRHEDLYRDEWVCLVSTTNTAVGDALTLDQLGALPWVVTFHSAAGTNQGMANPRVNRPEAHGTERTTHFCPVPRHRSGAH